MLRRYIVDIYFVFIILYSGIATYFYRSNEGFLFLFILSLIVFFNRILQPHKKLLIALGIWMTYFIVNSIIVGSFHPFFMITYIIKIILAWMLITYYGNKIFLKYENVLYFLSIISLFFWTWEVIHPNSLEVVLENLSVSGEKMQNVLNIDSKHIIVYTRGYRYSVGDIARNYGFAFEPGPFSSFVLIAILINLARTHFSIKGNKRLIVFTITLITAQSTTGLVGLLVLIIWATYNKYSKKYFLIGVPLALSLVVYLFFTVPILQEKIIQESEQDIEEVIRHSRQIRAGVSPGRFASLQLGWRDFKNFPLTGYGGHVEARYAFQRGADVSTINGFATIMSRYGAFGLFVFLVSIIITGKWLARYYNYQLFWVFPVVILIISFGFSIIESPILVTLWLFAYFYPKFVFNQSTAE